MFKRFFQKSRLFSLLLALPILGTTLIATPLQTPLLSNIKEKSMIQNKIQEEENPFFALIMERLQLAHDSAVYQWNHTLPIDDPDQEDIFLRSITSKAKSMQLDHSIASDFFTAQIEAAKMIHMEDFEGWVNENIHKHTYAPDLNSLEKKIQEVDDKLLLALKERYAKLPSFEQNTFKVQLMKVLQEHGFSRDVIDSVTHF